MEEKPSTSDGKCRSISEEGNISASRDLPFTRGMSQECLESSVNNLQEYETQLLGFTPKAFCDATYNAVLEYLIQYIEATVNIIQNEYSHTVSKERAEKAVNSIFLLSQKTVAPAFDRLETYLLKTIFRIPDGAVLPEDAVQESYSFTQADDESLDKELEELKEKILAEKYMEQVMRQELEQTALVQAVYEEFVTQLDEMDRTSRKSGVSDIKESILFANATAERLCELLERDQQSKLPDLHQKSNVEKEIDEARKKIKLELPHPVSTQ